MRLLFVSAQLPGHLDWGGYLLTAAEMARRGHSVLWASGPEVASLVGAQNVPFQPIATGWRWPPPPPLSTESSALSPEEQLQQKQIRSLDQWLDVDRVIQATRDLIQLGHDFQPDLVVSELFVAAAGLAAEALDVPLVVAGWPAPAQRTVSPERPAQKREDALVSLSRERLARIGAHFGLQGTNWSQTGPLMLLSPHLHLTYWSESWFSGVALGPQTRHVGGKRSEPAPPPPAGWPSPDDAPWVLITLGSSFNVDPNFFIAAAHAAVRMGCLPILATGADLESDWIRAMRSRLPASAIVRAYVDYAAVMPYLAAAIHHGGAGTTHALVLHAVPQAVVPHAGDQMRQAQGVTRTGVGMAITPKAVTIDLLVETLAALLPDLSAYRQRAQSLQAEFAALGGIPAAADLLTSVSVLS